MAQSLQLGLMSEYYGKESFKYFSLYKNGHLRSLVIAPTVNDKIN